MNDRQLSIPAHDRPTLRVETRTGRVTIVAETRDDILIEEGAPERGEISNNEGVVRFLSGRGGTKKVSLRCPSETDVVVGAGAGRVELEGSFGDVKVVTASGRITVDRAIRVDARSVSGSIYVEWCERGCRASSKSGKLKIKHAGAVKVSTISGRIELEQVDGLASIKTVSGKVDLGACGEGNVKVKTMSGAVRVEVPSQLKPSTSLRSANARTRCDCPEGDDFEIDVATMAGSIEVVPGL